jgi:hypothetical protein
MRTKLLPMWFKDYAESLIISRATQQIHFQPPSNLALHLSLKKNLRGIPKPIETPALDFK